eukprot:Nk52_evm40s1705 gene=Nk52_evmTU40s1705
MGAEASRFSDASLARSGSTGLSSLGRGGKKDSRANSEMSEGFLGKEIMLPQMEGEGPVRVDRICAVVGVNETLSVRTDENVMSSYLVSDKPFRLKLLLCVFSAVKGLMIVNDVGQKERVSVNSKYPDFEAVPKKSETGRVFYIGDVDANLDECQVFEGPNVLPPAEWPRDEFMQSNLYLLDGEGTVLFSTGTSFKVHSQDYVMVLRLIEKERAMRKEQMAESLGMDFHELDFLFTEEYKALGGSIALRPYRFITAADGAKLCYQEFMPVDAKPSVYIIHLHIPGYSSSMHQYFGEMMCTNHNACFLNVDVRGCGRSEGQLGKPNSRTQYLGDIRTIVRSLKWNLKGPVIVGGFGAGAGLALKYSGWKQREEADGYFFYGHEFGLDFDVWREGALDALDAQFATKYNYSNMVLDKITMGLLSNRPAMSSRTIPENEKTVAELHSQSLETNKIDLNVACVNQIYSSNPSLYFKSRIKKPFFVFAAENDELLDIVKLEKKVMQGKNSNIVKIPECKHLGAVFKIAEYFKPCIDKVKEKYVQPVDKKWAKNCRKRAEALAQKTFPETQTGNSLRELQHLLKDMPDVYPTYLEGRDGSRLMFYEVGPENDEERVATIIFHGVSFVFHQPLCEHLKKHYNIASVVFCYSSEGLKDYRPWHNSSESYLTDLKNVIDHIKYRRLQKPILLGGAGIFGSAMLSYHAWPKKSTVDGYIFISSPFSWKDESMVDMRRFNNVMRTKMSVRSYYNMCYCRKSNNAKMYFRKKYLSEIQKIEPNWPRKLNSEFVDTFAPVESEKVASSLDEAVCCIIGAKDKVLKADAVKRFAEHSFKTHPSMIKVTVLEDKGAAVEVLNGCGDEIGSWVDFIAKASATPEIPKRMDDANEGSFHIKQLVGRGTFGEVFLCIDKVTKDYYAMKVLDAKKIFRLKQVQHTIQEKQVLSKLHHPLCLSLVSAFKDNESLFMVTEYIVGGELYTLLKLCGRLEEKMTKFYVSEVLVAIDYLHSLGIVYRDLKPENILITAKGHIKLIDFGFAKEIGNGKAKSFVGSPVYIAPEVIKTREGYGKSCDLWSIGVLTVELLSGHLPFKNQNMTVLFNLICKSAYHPPSFFSEDEKSFVQGLLTKSPLLRLGCGKRGAQEVKEHPFFKHTDWELVEKCKTTPPYIPPFHSKGDTGNFLAVRPARKQVNSPIPGFTMDLFKGF